tara:strand:+ start:640 stop:882 length:243 start_codon:yes stop_codon:yes gene_type:complete
MLRLLNRADCNFHVLKGDSKNLSKTYYKVTHSKSDLADHTGRVNIKNTGKGTFQIISKANGKVRDEIRKKERKKKTAFVI